LFVQSSLHVTFPLPLNDAPSGFLKAILKVLQASYEFPCLAGAITFTQAQQPLNPLASEVLIQVCVVLLGKEFTISAEYTPHIAVQLGSSWHEKRILRQLGKQIERILADRVNFA
jgi:hypothetical protein